MTIVLFGYNYLFEKKKTVLFIVCLLIAFFIHSSSIIIVALLFLKSKYILKPFIIIPLIGIIFIFHNEIINLMSIFIENTRYSVYLVGLFAKGEASYLNIIINLVIYIYMHICYKIKKKNKQTINNNDYLFLNIQALAVTFMCMSIAHMLFSRIAYYFIIFQIISIPYFVETTEFKEINLGRNWTKRILYMLIIICFILSFSYTNILNNDNEPLPYKTIFNKEREFK